MVFSTPALVSLLNTVTQLLVQNQYVRIIYPWTSARLSILQGIMNYNIVIYLVEDTSLKRRPLESFSKKRPQKQGQSASLDLFPNLSHVTVKSTFELIYISR